jgi:hypothetical protein
MVPSLKTAGLQGMAVNQFWKAAELLRMTADDLGRQRNFLGEQRTIQGEQ